MNIVQSLVDRHRFRRVASTEPKLATLEHLLIESAAMVPAADLLVLSAGYLTAPKAGGVPVLIGRVAALAQAHKVAVLFGVDLPKSKGNGDKRGHERRVRSQNIPYWGVAIDQNGAILGRWRQQSIVSTDVQIAPPLKASTRLTTIAKKTVAVMICGEIFNAAYRDSMRAEQFDLVVDLGHYSMTTGVVPALQNIVDGKNRWAIHTHHVLPISAKAHAIGPGGNNVRISSVGSWREVPKGGWRVFTTTRTV